MLHKGVVSLGEIRLLSIGKQRHEGRPAEASPGDATNCKEMIGKTQLVLRAGIILQAREHEGRPESGANAAALGGDNKQGMLGPRRPFRRDIAMPIFETLVQRLESRLRARQAPDFVIVIVEVGDEREDEQHAQHRQFVAVSKIDDDAAETGQARQTQEDHGG